MIFEAHQIGQVKIAEVISETPVVLTVAEGTNLLGEVYYQGFDGLILHRQQLASAFFDLQTGFAGDLLQKFSNFRVRLAIVGDFEKFPGKSLRDFMFESNKGRQVNFVGSVAEAIARLSE